MLRNIEDGLRKLIYKYKHFPADMVLTPYITFPAAIENSGYGLHVTEETLKIDEKSNVSSHKYSNQFENDEDIEKIKDMYISYDSEETARRNNMLADILHDIAPVREKGISFHSGLWDFVSMYMCVEDIYLDLIDRPDFLHRIMEKMTHSIISGIKQANALKIHDTSTNSCHCTYTYSEKCLPDRYTVNEGVSYNCRTFGMAQLFTSVSKSVTEEFEIPYISEIASYLGNIYYGCCEKLSDRLDVISKIPNLRKISCSPWSEPDEFAETIPKNIVMSVKPNPAFLAAPSLDEYAIKKNIQVALDAAKRNNVCVEFLLKDISTVKYCPERLEKWNNIVMDMVNAW